MSEQYKYRAFISYSHADEKWAAWLHKALETYKVPKHLVGQTTDCGPVPARIAPIFRDREELATSTELGDVLTEALSQSACLIVICSPNAAKSRWTNEEILTFKRLGRQGRIFCLIINGEFPQDTYFEGTATTGGDNAIFAKLILELFDDLVDAVADLACEIVDDQASKPLSPLTCSNFASSAANTGQKLFKCVDATTEPKSSSSSENCQAAEIHLANLEDEIAMFSLYGEDPANRIGEMNVRIKVLQNVYFNLFYPSIPEDGF